jgi:hypothetical protein
MDYRSTLRVHLVPFFGDAPIAAITPGQIRGRAAARTEWRLITATHNLLKLWRHTIATQPA